jgi:PAS domain-containing protein
VDKSDDVEGLALSRWERVLAGTALVVCLVAITVDGPWRWLALPCIAVLFFLALRRTNRTEQALTRSQEDYRYLVDLPVQATYIADAAGALLHISRRWSDWTGLDFATTAQSNWIEAIHPDDRERSAAHWRNASSPESPMTSPSG